MKKLNKMYKLKPRAAKWLNEHADAIHSLPSGAIEDKQVHNFNKNSRDFYLLLVDESSASVPGSRIYLALWCSEIGFDCHYVDESDLGVAI